MVFIAGNLPMKTQIVPMVIIDKLTGEHDVVAACAMAVVMLAASFVLLFLINLCDGFRSRRHVWRPLTVGARRERPWPDRGHGAGRDLPVGS